MKITFFSNTIINYTLPEVATVRVSTGIVSQRVDCSGVVEYDEAGGKYTMTAYVSKEDSLRVSAGMKAEVMNNWNGDITAKTESIVPAEEDPNHLVYVKFVIEGNVKEGDALQLAVGGSNERYDMVVPNSAVREDVNGSFVLVLISKSTPLGNRYVAKRVSVVVEAKNNVYSAVSGNLSASDSVITISSKPIVNNSQVRLSDKQ